MVRKLAGQGKVTEMPLVRLLVLKKKALLRFWGWIASIRIRSGGGQCGNGVLADGVLHLKYPSHSGLVIGDRVSIGKNVSFDVPPGGKLVVGDRVKFNMDIVVAAISEIRIGADTLIGEFVSIRDSDHGIVKSGVPIQEQELISAPIYIDADGWLGRGCVILRGVNIGKGCVVGANAVVRAGNYSQYSILVGVPARVAKVRS